MPRTKANKRPSKKKKTHTCPSDPTEKKFNPLLKPSVEGGAELMASNLPKWIRKRDPNMDTPSHYDTMWIYWIIRCWNGGGVRYGDHNIILFDHNEEAIVNKNARIPSEIVKRILQFERYYWRTHIRFVATIQDVEYWTRPFFEHHFKIRPCSTLCTRLKLI